MGQRCCCFWIRSGAEAREWGRGALSEPLQTAVAGLRRHWDIDRRVQNFTLSLTCCVSLDKSLNSSKLSYLVSAIMQRLQEIVMQMVNHGVPHIVYHSTEKAFNKRHTYTYIMHTVAYFGSGR